MAEEVIVWIEYNLYDRFLKEAKKQYPSETGGVLMGYWGANRTEVVVKHIIGPGPNAIHEPHYFEPDTEYQSYEISRIYCESGRIFTYLGDWHTHPDGNIKLSQLDKRTLRQIAVHTESRAPNPLMLIIGGSQESPLIGIYVLIRYKFLGFPYLFYKQCKLKLFDIDSSIIK